MYLTIKEAKSFQIEVINNLSDLQLETLIRLYSGIVEDYCHTKFKPTLARQRASIKQKIRVEKTPLISVQSVVYLSEPLSEFEHYAVYTEQNYIALEEPSLYLKKRQSLDVAYFYGFEEVPSLVKKVIVDLIKVNLQDANTDNTFQSESWDSEYSYTRRSDSLKKLEKEILSLLDGYKQAPYEPIEIVGEVRARLL